MRIIENKTLRHKIVVVLSLLIGLIFTYISSKGEVNEEQLQRSIAEKIVRFHVIANSDSKEDQELKLKVKKEVVDYIAPLLSNSSCIDESEEILMREKENIRDIALTIIEANGYDYDVHINMENCYFPAKTYGDIILPQGEYNAFNIRIGESQGKNWWCILYPPLCFVDVTHGVVPDESKNMLKNILDEDEYELVTTGEVETEFRIKLFEIFG